MLYENVLPAGRKHAWTAQHMLKHYCVPGTGAASGQEHNEDERRGEAEPGLLLAVVDLTGNRPYFDTRVLNEHGVKHYKVGRGLGRMPVELCG